MNLNSITKMSIAALTAVITLSSCVSDVRTKMIKKEPITQTLEEKGKNLLDRARKAHNVDAFQKHQVYEVEAVDHWKGMMGRMAKLWPEREGRIRLKYDVGSFDGSVEYLDGKKQGMISGLQSWKYYEQEPGATVEFKKKQGARTTFGLAAYHYFFELIDRMQTAEIISYAGEKEFLGKKYDLVFVTWGKVKAHKQHDQYVVWINQETSMVDFTDYTVHDVYMPGGAMIPASIQFADYQMVDGVPIPFRQNVFMGSPKKKENKYLHQLRVESFKFDSFDRSELYPAQNIAPVGNTKAI